MKAVQLWNLTTCRVGLSLYSLSNENESRQDGEGRQKNYKFDTYDCVLCRLDRSVVNAAGRLVTLMTFTVCITRMQIHNTPNNNMQCYVLNELLLCLFVEFV